MLQRLDYFARFSLPVGLTVGFVLLSVIPLRAPDFASISPMLVLPCLYYWAIYRPQVVPLIAVFLIGVFEDLLTGAPLGMNALGYLVAFGLVAGQRRFFLGKSFSLVWWGYMLVAAAVLGLRWLLFCLLSGTIVDPMPGLFTYFSSVAVYPVLTLLLAVTHRLLPQQSEGMP